MRLETSPEDLRGMIAAEGILTARGGVSSHAALVARQMVERRYAWQQTIDAFDRLYTR